jgi:hypothetical protein
VFAYHDLAYVLASYHHARGTGFGESHFNDLGSNVDRSRPLDRYPREWLAAKGASWCRAEPAPPLGVYCAQTLIGCKKDAPQTN